MSNNRRGGLALPRKAYADLMDALGEGVLALDDGDIVTETLAEGVDPMAAAEGVRGLLRQTAKDYRQRYLRAAAVEHRRRVEAMSDRWLDLPDSAADRRQLLATLFAKNPGMGDAYLTIQHREFTALSDQDVESCLLQLLELGVLVEEPPGGAS